MLRAAGVALLVALLAGCAHGGGRSDLRVELQPRPGETGMVSVLHCDPPRGDAPDPAPACRAGDRSPDRSLDAHDVGGCGSQMAAPGAPPSASPVLLVQGHWRGDGVDDRYSCSDAALRRWVTLLRLRLVTNSD